MIPTKDENPDGLHQKYIITKADGSPVDPNAIYFVLRLDYNNGDDIHIHACRSAAYQYCVSVKQRLTSKSNLWLVAEQLLNLLHKTRNFR